jgi:hypothetical protein
MNRRISALLFALVLGGPAFAAHNHAAPKGDPKAAWQKSLARPALAVGATFDAQGRLWRVSTADGFVEVRHSEDKGRTFSAAVRVNREAARIAGDGDNRPKIAVAGNGTVVVSYTEHLAEPFSGHVYLSRSTDGGRSFSAPLRVNSDDATISHRFESLAIDQAGRVHVVWIDKRDQAAARARGAPYAGAALYHAVVKPDEWGPVANRKLIDHSCECCRIALALDTDSTPVAVWRHVYEGNIRDHALLRLDGKSQPARVAHDGWKIDACPHHGPSLAVDAVGNYHVAWFTGAPDRAGLYYARSSDRGKTFGVPQPIGNAAAQAARPAVLAAVGKIYLAWKEFDGKASVVYAMHSKDGGATWSAPKETARSASASDHPLLIADWSEARSARHGSRDRGSDDGAAVYLSWYASTEGFRLVPLP